MDRFDLRRMGPLTAGRPLVADTCPACKRQFQAGDYVTLVSLGPGDDPEEQEKAREGRAFTAVAQAVHWSCATGERP